MTHPHILYLVGMVLALLASILAAEKASGNMPFSGYKEEKFWGIVSIIFLIIAAVLAVLAFLAKWPIF